MTQEPFSYKTIAAFGSLCGIIVVLGGIIWFQSALAAQVTANTEAVHRMEAMPERLVRVETKVDSILIALHAN